MEIDSINSLSSLGVSAARNVEQMDPTDPLRATANAAVGASDEKKKQLAKDFETVFISKMFDEVKESIGSLSLDEEEQGISDQVDGLFWMYMAQDIGEKGGFGMWKDIYRHFQQMDGITPAGGQISKEL